MLVKANTRSIHIKRGQVRQLITALKQIKIRHGPFNRTRDGYLVVIEDNSKVDLLLLLIDNIKLINE